MRVDIQFKIKNDPMLKKFLRENSYWYKYLNRNPDMIDIMVDKMKEKYKLTTADKINDLSDKLDLIKTFMSVLK